VEKLINLLKAIPRWLLIIGVFFLVIVVSVALYDGRAIEVYGLKIDGREVDCVPVEKDPNYVEIVKQIESCKNDLEGAIQKPSIDFVKGGEGGCLAACSSEGLKPVITGNFPINERPVYLCIAETIYGKRGGFNYNYEQYKGACIYHEFETFGAVPYECVCK